MDKLSVSHVSGVHVKRETEIEIVVDELTAVLRDVGVETVSDRLCDILDGGVSNMLCILKEVRGNMVSG